MTPSNVIAVGCLALTAATIWIGSHCLPNHKEPKDLPATEEPIRPNLRRVHYPSNPRGFYPNIDHIAILQSPRHNRREWTDRVPFDSWRLTPSRFDQTQRNTARILFENWRRSIFGLLALSETNLRSAKDRFDIGFETGAIQKARTAVENMARALIHCCGGKPDSDPGQEEVLKMLSLRFKAETKAAYDNAVDKIHYLLTNDKAEHTLQIAEEITSTFKKVILNNFGEELQLRSPTVTEY